MVHPWHASRLPHKSCIGIGGRLGFALVRVILGPKTNFLADVDIHMDLSPNFDIPGFLPIMCLLTDDNSVLAGVYWLRYEWCEHSTFNANYKLYTLDLHNAIFIHKLPFLSGVNSQIDWRSTYSEVGGKWIPQPLRNNNLPLNLLEKQSDYIFNSRGQTFTGF